MSREHGRHPWKTMSGALRSVMGTGPELDAPAPPEVAAPPVPPIHVQTHVVETEPVSLSEFHRADHGAYLRSLTDVGETWVRQLENSGEPHDWPKLISWDERIRDASGAASTGWRRAYDELSQAPLWVRSRAGMAAWQTRFLHERLGFLERLRAST
jgi:hypothetical protein